MPRVSGQAAPLRGSAESFPTENLTATGIPEGLASFGSAISSAGPADATSTCCCATLCSWIVDTIRDFLAKFPFIGSFFARELPPQTQEPVQSLQTLEPAQLSKLTRDGLTENELIVRLDTLRKSIEGFGTIDRDIESRIRNNAAASVWEALQDIVKKVRQQQPDFTPVVDVYAADVATALNLIALVDQFKKMVDRDHDLRDSVFSRMLLDVVLPAEQERLRLIQEALPQHSIPVRSASSLTLLQITDRISFIRAAFVLHGRAQSDDELMELRRLVNHKFRSDALVLLQNANPPFSADGIELIDDMLEQFWEQAKVQWTTAPDTEVFKIMKQAQETEDLLKRTVMLPMYELLLKLAQQEPTVRYSARLPLDEM